MEVSRKMPEHVIDLLNEVDANKDVEKLLKALNSRRLNPGNMLIQFVSSLPTSY
jgi:hypothetical protein